MATSSSVTLLKGVEIVKDVALKAFHNDVIRRRPASASWDLNPKVELAQEQVSRKEGESFDWLSDD